MKVEKMYIAFLALFTLVLFVGCQQSEMTENENAGTNTSLGVDEAEENEGGEPSVDQLLEMQNKLSSIVLSGDLEKCKELSLQQYLDGCEVNILANRAKSAEDFGVCDQATTEINKAQCKNLVGNRTE